TMFFDMPLNAHPPTCDKESFELKKTAAQAKSVTDFALWGGLVPGNLDKLEELAKCGVIGFKAFMSNSGIEDFCSVEDKVLRAGMKIAAELRLPVAVHAESDTMTAQLSQKAIAENRTSIRDYLRSRPIVAELDAIRRAIDISAETGCKLHVVHVSSAAGVRLVDAARGHGVDVSCETCPHYLILNASDVEELGAVAKCAPPLRSEFERKKLYNAVMAGLVQTIGSDHSPAPADMKTSENFFKVWGGISSVQHTLALLINFLMGSDDKLTIISTLTSSNVAKRFNLPKTKGRIAIGCHADLALVNLSGRTAITKQDILYRHKQSPYMGRQLTSRIERTMRRGKTIFANGKIIAKTGGRLIKPLNTEH
ncbi:MAG: allantoinase AllB, partial [Limisphaerales bacterium]